MLTTETDYRRGYAQGYAAAAQDAKSPRLKRFLLEHIVPWRYEADPQPTPAPKMGAAK